jgi:CHRD domain-containing protein
VGVTAITTTETLLEHLMGLKHSVIFAALATFVLGACNEDNQLGLGVGANDRFSASLAGSNIRPAAVATTATGSAQISILEPGIGQGQPSLAVQLTVGGLTSATAAHIHLGGAAVSGGPILLTLFSNPTDTALTSTTLVNGTIAASSLVGVSLDSLKTLMQLGTAYVDVHTTPNPNGVIRGQLARSGEQAPGDVFAAKALSGAKERPTPVTSTAGGSATFELINSTTVRYTLSVTGITGATMAHIHTAVADSAGPVAVTLFSSATPTGPLTGTLASGSFTSTDMQLPGVSFDSLLALMRRGRTYVNVHTVLNPGGEIRAQIDPVSAIPK